MIAKASSFTLRVYYAPRERKAAQRSFAFVGQMRKVYADTWELGAAADPEINACREIALKSQGTSRTATDPVDEVTYTRARLHYA